MTKAKYTIIIIFILAFCFLAYNNAKLKKECQIAQNNVTTLLDSAKQYKVADSLNAVSVKELSLKLSEYKQYRADDATLIKQLKADKPQTVAKAIMQTHTEIITRFDTVYVDSAKHFSYADKWTEVDGLVYKDSVKLDIKNNEELLIVESIQRKKFLFIKLPVKLFGYKHKQIDVMSKNKNTQIMSAEFISIEQ